jgi:peptide deformylase
MAPYRILRIDDPADNKILKSRSQPVKLPNPGLQPLIDDMITTMHLADGAGLAAPQIGLLQRIIVIFVAHADADLPPQPVAQQRSDGTHYVLINPQIIKASADDVTVLDGCLSLPGWYGAVPRSRWVTVDYQDMHGRRQRIRKAEGLLSYALQHEIDHLNGVLYTERITELATFKRYRLRGEAV